MIQRNDGNGNHAAALELCELGWRVIPLHWIQDGKCSCGDTDCTSPAKHPVAFFAPHGFQDASNEPATVEEWWSQVPNANIGVRTGIDFWVLDPDGQDGVHAIDELATKNAGLLDTVTSQTGGGGRHYFFAADARVRTRVKIGGLSVDVRGPDAYVVVPPSSHVSGDSYRWVRSPGAHEIQPAPDWLIEFVASAPSGNNGSPRLSGFETLVTHPGAAEGERNNVLCRLVGIHLHRDGANPDLLGLALAWGKRCTPPLDEGQIVRTVESLVRKHEEGSQGGLFTLNSSISYPVSWPKSLDEAAFHGLAGDIVRLIEPHTEADPAGILVQLLAAFGSAVGRFPYFQVESDRHYLKLFVVLVGRTSKGRKGTSWGHVRRLFRLADKDWVKSHIGRGLCQVKA